MLFSAILEKYESIIINLQVFAQMALFDEQKVQEQYGNGKFEEGRQEGENLITALINKLSAAVKNEDIIKMANDATFRESLFIQYGLKKCSLSLNQ